MNDNTERCGDYEGKADLHLGGAQASNIDGGACRRASFRSLFRCVPVSAARASAPTLVSRQAHILRSFGYFGIVSTYNLIVIFVKVLDN